MEEKSIWLSKKHCTRYITDGDSEIKPGATLSEQIRCYEDFDSVKVHITGRKGKW